MSTHVTVERLSPFVDARGLVAEPLENSAIQHQQNSHLVITAPGGIRGNHYHPRGAETCLVLGPALVGYREQGKVHEVIVESGAAVRFYFPPGVPHAMKNIGSSPMVLLSFNTVAHDPAQPDTVREVILPA